MTRDIGRARAYRAEAIAFGGHWFQPGCRSRLLTEAEAREFHAKVAIFAKQKFDLVRRLPNFRISNGAGSYFVGGDCYYRLAGLRECAILHEVAHWATCGRNDGRAHGAIWQNMYATLIREFVDGATADEFLKQCRELPIMKVAAGPKKRWILQERRKEDFAWTNSNFPRKKIPNWQRLAMWRGEVCWVQDVDRVITMRMIEAD